MKFEQWSSVGVTELELECLTDQVTLVTELSEQILGFLWLHASRRLVLYLVPELAYVKSLDCRVDSVP